MFEKIKNLSKSPLFKELQDVRMLGWVAFCIIALLVSWSGVKVIQTNYELQKQISALQQEKDVQELQNNNLKLKNEYYNTNEFLELAARRQFGKALPGETEVLVPKSVALAHTVNTSSAAPLSSKSSVQQSKSQANFQAWMDFFLHRTD